MNRQVARSETIPRILSNGKSSQIYYVSWGKGMTELLLFICVKITMTPKTGYIWREKENIYTHT